MIMEFVINPMLELVSVCLARFGLHHVRMCDFLEKASQKFSQIWLSLQRYRIMHAQKKRIDVDVDTRLMGKISDL